MYFIQPIFCVFASCFYCVMCCAFFAKDEWGQNFWRIS